MKVTRIFSHFVLVGSHRFARQKILFSHSSVKLSLFGKPKIFL